MNDKYRSDAAPSELHQRTFLDVCRGLRVNDEDREEMVSRLYEPFSAAEKDTPVDPWEPTLPTQDEGNGLACAVVKHDFKITLHVSEKLYHHQPIGVLLGPINEAVRRAGEALVTNVCPRSEDVESTVMPAKHYKVSIEPLPLWLSKWVGENGYTTTGDDQTQL